MTKPKLSYSRYKDLDNAQSVHPCITDRDCQIILDGLDRIAEGCKNDPEMTDHLSRLMECIEIEMGCDALPPRKSKYDKIYGHVTK
jgi:hypothetical protein